MTERTGRLSVILALQMTVASQGLAQRATTDRALDARVNALIAPEAAPGRFSGVVLVARGDRIVVQRSYGFADWERNVPNSSTSRFGVGSITKVMTETIVDLLVQAGRLDLLAPVAKYLDGFPDGPKGGHATIRDLLTHRAGVPHRVTTELEETEPLNAADIVERVKARGLRFEPGSSELYSSAGFTCLARVVEIVEHKPFDSVLVERIFRPASMTWATDETSRQLMTGRAMPYVLQEGPVTVSVASARYKDLSFLSGAGSVYASGGDLLHFVRTLHRGTFGSVAQKLLGSATDTTWTGWYGRTNGYEASVDFLPAGDLTVILLSNLRSGANWQIRQRLRKLVLGRAISDIPPPPPVARPFENFAEIVGLYGDPADPVEVAEKEGRLFRDGDAIYPISGRLYYSPVSAAVTRFGRDASGNVEVMLTRFGTDPERSAPRVGRR
jgi:CubicO group peptidase (beta-lactamase class C family)